MILLLLVQTLYCKEIIKLHPCFFLVRAHSINSYSSQGTYLIYLKLSLSMINLKGCGNSRLGMYFFFFQMLLQACNFINAYIKHNKTILHHKLIIEIKTYISHLIGAKVCKKPCENLWAQGQPLLFFLTLKHTLTDIHNHFFRRYFYD